MGKVTGIVMIMVTVMIMGTVMITLIAMDIVMDTATTIPMELITVMDIATIQEP